MKIKTIQLSKGTASLYRDSIWCLRVYVGKKQRAFKLGHKRDLPKAKDVRDAADRKLLELRLATDNVIAKVTLDQFIKSWYLLVIEGRLRPSTCRGYRGMWERYIKGRNEMKLPLYQVRTRHVQNLLGGIAMDHNNLSQESLKHIKAFLSGVFRHARANGFLNSDLVNPVQGTLLPRMRRGKRETGVYTLQEIQAALAVLTGAERAAFAIGGFSGLRLAEIQGLRWKDYDAKEAALEVQQTRWKHHVNPPKTMASRNWVPVLPPLAEILDAYKDESPFGERYKAPRLKDYAEDAMFKISLEDAGQRTIRPALERAGLEWKGWHALRRGLASNLFELGVDDLTVMRILRHASVSVTRQHYIRVRDAKVEDAMQKLNAAISLASSGKVAAGICNREQSRVSTSAEGCVSG